VFMGEGVNYVNLAMYTVESLHIFMLMGMGQTFNLEWFIYTCIDHY